MKPKTTLSARKAVLVALQAGLNKRVISIKHELASHNDPDWEDLATDREDDEVLEARATSANHDLRQIEAALQRAEAGTYGLCARCGTDIEEARLDALPSTPFCKDCAATVGASPG